MKIVKLSQETLPDINKANQPFEIIGQIKPSFVDGEWSYTEELYEHSYEKSYPNDEQDYSVYIDNADKAIFLVYFDTECTGQIVLRKDWNRYAFIEDICVAKNCRGQGVGLALIKKATEWAKESQLNGLALETQDNNLLACRFYKKCGFKIGGGWIIVIYNHVPGKEMSDFGKQAVDAFLDNPEVWTYNNPMSYSLDKWLAYIASQDDSPLPGSPEYDAHISALHAAFERNSVDGLLCCDRVTKLYCKRM